MKKLNVSEVSNVIGGTFTSCVVSYAKETVGTTTVCRKITECQSKFGETRTSVPADLSSCA
ncbi:uncharacterized protein DUF4762 [Serratia fonticola]|jgi:hypothetical protein|uniref:Uncharacterized protein DUF4762 n=1 Tax=Serratia fonticola TaxID=47917 RepID=A0A542BKL9_SERFO|nr:uncharacterized protein DUF4762 [Serratia fonticola]TQI98842.1 uncharacterized protein DUF4762 [Serratia fonticola]TVZ68368.1 uncharacterized protein DUF4762 [Serratia fonticola]